jgi:hypothetical protein
VEEAFINVQCAEESGKVGDFLTRGRGATDRKAISPIFDSLDELLRWMQGECWVHAEYVHGEFIPWRVEKRPV